MHIYSYTLQEGSSRYLTTNRFDCFSIYKLLIYYSFVLIKKMLFIYVGIGTQSTYHMWWYIYIILDICIGTSYV